MIPEYKKPLYEFKIQIKGCTRKVSIYRRHRSFTAAQQDMRVITEQGFYYEDGEESTEMWSYIPGRCINKITVKEGVV
jgi:hypothetical protein